MSAIDAPTRPLSVAAPAVVAFLFGVYELSVLLATHVTGQWSQPARAWVLLALTVLALGVNGMVAVGVDRLVGSRLPRARLHVWILGAAVFGLGWQDSVMHGDGVRAHRFYELVRVVGAVAGPLVVAAWVWFLGFTKRGPRWLRPALAVVVVVAGAVVSQVLFTGYDRFHGYLVLFALGHLVWVLAPWMRGRAVAAVGWSLAVLSAVSVLLAPDWMAAQRSAQRFAEIPGAVLALPWMKPAVLPPESVLDPDASFSSQSIAEMRRNLGHWRDELSGTPSGSNVLLVVLESTRADLWADPAVTPSFHGWKRHGLYVPRAVAQYPATPLAYGAMFTSHPPSVLTQTPVWAKSRLFDLLSRRFDHLVLSRPRNEWFDESAITDFFVPRDAEVLQHDSVVTGLANLRRGLGRVRDEQSFFAWVHIYEPHQPWVRRPKYVRGKGQRAAHESEVRYVDAELGKFMQWFYARPYAKDTLVIVIADHGEGLGERIDGKPYWGHHVHVRSVVSHIPAYFSGPGIPAGETRDLPLAQLDLMPTMFDFLGEELPADTLAQGRSLYAVMRDPAPRDLVTEAFSIRGKEFFDFVEQVRQSDAQTARERFQEVTSEGKYSPKIGVQYGRYKLVRDMLLQENELYDVVADPDESDDLAAKEPERLEELTARLQAWRDRQSWIVGELER